MKFDYSKKIGLQRSMATNKSLIKTIRCACHEKFIDKTSGTAKLRLVLASIIALVFMVGEILGELNNKSYP